MSISNLELGVPDSDGDVSIAYRLSFTNDTSEDIREIKIYTTAFSAGGECLGASVDERPVRAKAGSSIELGEISCYLRALPATATDGMTIQSTVHLFSRKADTARDIKVPDEGQTGQLTLRLPDSVTKVPSVLSIRRGSPDSDGDYRLEVIGAVQSQTDKAARVRLEVKLFEQDSQDQIDETYDEQDLPARASQEISASMYMRGGMDLDGTVMQVNLVAMEVVSNEITFQG